MSFFNSNNLKTIIECKLTETEYTLLSIFHIMGMTSYRSIYKKVFISKSSKILKVINTANIKAKEGYLIEEVYVKFYKSRYEYIYIPYSVFSQVKDIGKGKLQNSDWFKTNIAMMKRYNSLLFKMNPKLFERLYKQHLQYLR